MRALLPLLILLLAFSGMRPAGAQPMAPCAMMTHDAHRGALHHDCACCVGCATLLPDAARPVAGPALPAALAPVASLVRRLAGLTPAATAPPPRARG